MKSLYKCFSSLVIAMGILAALLVLLNGMHPTMAAPLLTTEESRQKKFADVGKTGQTFDHTTLNLVTVITITTASDALNGDCSSVDALFNNPGPDGISLREAITAANNTPGSEEILFAPQLAGAVIMIGDSGPDALPVLTGGGLTINGDINNDGIPDVTLDGSLGGPNTPLGNCLSIWSDNNTINKLNIVEFDQAIQFGVPNFWFGPTKTISGNRIINNVISSTRGIFIGPLGWIRANETERLSNLTWQHTLISGNHITAPEAIFMYAGAAAANNNQILTTTVTDNRIYGGGSIGLLAGDTNTLYHGTPGLTQYSDNNRVYNVSIVNNILQNVTYNAITIIGANMGNRSNQIQQVRVISNTILRANVGIMVLAAGESEPAYRDTISNTVSDIYVEGNHIEDTWYGIISGAGGHLFVRQSTRGINANILENVTVANNVT